MREVCKKIGVAITGISLLVSCKGDGTLLDLYPMKPIVNSEVGILIQDNRIVYAHLNDRQRISGITEKGVFETADKFQSFDFDSYPWQVGQEAVAFGEDLIVHAPNDGLSFSLRYSTDHGKSWTVYDKPLLDESDLAAGRTTVNQLLVSTGRSVWLLCRQDNGSGGRALLYRVDLGAGSSELLFSEVHVNVLATDFSGAESGWLLYTMEDEADSRVHILKTIDGGHSWSEGAMLDGIQNPTIEAITADRLLVYDETGVAYHSTDGGDSFVPVAIGEGGIGLCQAASAHVIYALLTSGMAKSTDGGQTWSVLNAQIHGVEISGLAMYFYNERQGIVYGDDKLFFTDNGGENWDILIYPYDYVFR